MVKDEPPLIWLCVHPKHELQC